MLLGYDTIKEIFGALETLGATCRILCHNSAGKFLQGGVCFLATTKMRLTSGCLPFSEAIARNFSSYYLYYVSKITRVQAKWGKIGPSHLSSEHGDLSF